MTMLTAKHSTDMSPVLNVYLQEVEQDDPVNGGKRYDTHVVVRKTSYKAGSNSTMEKKHHYFSFSINHLPAFRMILDDLMRNACDSYMVIALKRA